MAFSAFAQRAGLKSAFNFGIAKTPTATVPVKTFTADSTPPTDQSRVTDDAGTSTPTAHQVTPVQATLALGSAAAEPTEPATVDRSHGSLELGTAHGEGAAPSDAADLHLEGAGEGEGQAGQEEVDPDVSAAEAMKGSMMQGFMEIGEIYFDRFLALMGKSRSIKETIKAVKAEAADVAGKKRARIADMVSTVEKKLRMLKDIETGAGLAQEEEHVDEEEEEEVGERQREEEEARAEDEADGMQHMEHGAGEQDVSKDFE